MPDPRGLVFDIQRFSLFNGPGIRTTVFFKGCPLRCPWCHNPEGVASEPELLFNPHLCVACGNCLTVCAHSVHSQGPEGSHVLDRSACKACGACTEACPSNALELCGKRLGVNEVMDVVLRDRGYYTDSGGGLTLSGGEPLLQPEFARALLTAARAEGLHTALETSGCVAWKRIESILEVTDLFLFDVKETDADRHEQLTGVPLAPIRRNLQKLAARGAHIVLRLPMIPGCNDRLEHILAVARLASELNISEADLLPYHRLGENKSSALGHVGMPCSFSVPGTETSKQWQAQFEQAGLKVRLAKDR